MDKNTRALEILKLTSEIAIIDDILDEDFNTAMKNVCERDKPLVRAYKDASADELLASRDNLEAKLQLA